MRSAFSTDGTQTRGSVNNRANGYTPWSTYLTREENWAGYFNRREDNANRTGKEVTAFSRYGIGNATSGRYNWSRAGDTTDIYRRWDASATDSWWVRSPSERWRQSWPAGRTPSQRGRFFGARNGRREKRVD